MRASAVGDVDAAAAMRPELDLPAQRCAMSRQRSLSSPGQQQDAQCRQGEAHTSGDLGAHELLLQPRHPFSHAAHSSRRILPQAICLQVHSLADLFLGHDDTLLGVSDQHQVEPLLPVVNLAHGQARSVDRDVALGDDERQDRVTERDLDPQGLPFLLELQDLAGLIHMALHEVPGVPVVRGHRALQVHGAAHLEVAEVRAPQGLRRAVHLEGLRVEGRASEASAVDRDAASDVGALHGHLAPNLQDEPLGLRPVPHLEASPLVDSQHLTHLLDYASEHHGGQQGTEAQRVKTSEL
mmetsp:Transcript_150119/g.482492  ORF Transcript_150119/g.482492 Transcript_150119/m.482492 type:complete len:296 (+) Transcript_150119:101-988(+)